MEELYNITFLSLDRYFKVLEKTGYIKDSDVNKMLLLTFLQEFMLKYSGYITEEDYSLISRILSCLAGSSCLVPYAQFKLASVPMQGYVSDIFVRITEDEILRHTEADLGLRLVIL